MMEPSALAQKQFSQTNKTRFSRADQRHVCTKRSENRHFSVREEGEGRGVGRERGEEWGRGVGGRERERGGEDEKKVGRVGWSHGGILHAGTIKRFAYKNSFFFHVGLLIRMQKGGQFL